VLHWSRPWHATTGSLPCWLPLTGTDPHAPHHMGLLMSPLLPARLSLLIGDRRIPDPRPWGGRAHLTDGDLVLPACLRGAPEALVLARPHPRAGAHPNHGPHRHRPGPARLPDRPASVSGINKGCARWAASANGSTLPRQEALPRGTRPHEGTLAAHTLPRLWPNILVTALPHLRVRPLRRAVAGSASI
jgi:hypothetical protein